MKRMRPNLLRILHPRIALIMLATFFGGAAVIITFTADWGSTPFGYASYVLSAYAMTVLIINFSAIIKSVKMSATESNAWKRAYSFLYSRTYGRRYLTDFAYRVRISLILSLALNLSFAAVKLIAGIYYASFWYGADAIYYIVLSAARIMLMRHVRSGKNDMAAEHRLYRACGVFLFAINIALTGVVYQIIDQNTGYKYPGLLIYVVAIFAFIFITTAVVNVVRLRRLNSPILSAVKMVDLVKAMVAMFALQSAMFASFGDSGDGVEATERLMNTIFGSILCISIFGIAVFMVVRANKNLKSVGRITK